MPPEQCMHHNMMSRLLAQLASILQLYGKTTDNNNNNHDDDNSNDNNNDNDDEIAFQLMMSYVH